MTIENFARFSLTSYADVIRTGLLSGGVLDELRVKAWTDPEFSVELQAEPNSAIRSYLTQNGVEISGFPDVESVLDLIGVSPVGEPPSVSGGAFAQLGPTDDDDGLVPSVTADCFCPPTLTGACACLTWAGTPCISGRICGV